jgi:hypothetical protein
MSRAGEKLGLVSLGWPLPIKDATNAVKFQEVVKS